MMRLEDWEDISKNAGICWKSGDDHDGYILIDCHWRMMIKLV